MKNRNRYAALDIKDYNKVIAEGKTIEELIRKADETGEDYIISPILEEGTIYIFNLI